MSTETIEFDEFDVNDGPSADRVIDALKYAFSKSGDRVTAEFSVRRSDAHIRGILSWLKLEVQIIGVTYATSSPGMFILTVNVPGFATSEGFYDANTRKGHFRLGSPVH